MMLKVHLIPTVPSFNFSPTKSSSSLSFASNVCLRIQNLREGRRRRRTRRRSGGLVLASLEPSLDLTEDNVRRVLADARTKFAQIFDTSAGMTGQVELAEVDGPFVKISLRGRFWHQRSTVLARIANYLKQRIPEILEVDIEDENQLDDSPASF